MIANERRVMRRSTAWTYRCPLGHSVVVSVRGKDEPEEYGRLFRQLHADCLPDEVAS